MYTTEEKSKIKSAFDIKCERQQFTRNKAAASMNISPTTLSQVLSNNYGADDSNIWKQIAIWSNYFTNESWTAVSTRNFNLITRFLEDARSHANTYAIIGDAGCGKTFSVKQYAANNPGAYLVQCSEYWSKKDFLGELLRSMGKDRGGMSIPEMMNLITTTLQQENNSVVILDEADKLNDPSFIFFITLYNRLEDHTGMVMFATDHLEKRMIKGVRLNRKGYKEIFSRVGRKFIELEVPGKKDVIDICYANGIDDDKIAMEIYKDSIGDLRRTKRLIHKQKLLKTVS